MKKTTIIFAIAMGIILSLVFIFPLSMEVIAGPPEKDICPAPKSTSERVEAVRAACRYFGMVSGSWGDHLSFGPNGEVIT